MRAPSSTGVLSAVTALVALVTMGVVLSKPLFEEEKNWQVRAAWDPTIARGIGAGATDSHHLPTLCTQSITEVLIKLIQVLVLNAVGNRNAQMFAPRAAE